MNYYFIALLVLCTAYALVAGGAPERIGALFYSLSCVATYASWARAATWHEIQSGVLAIDVVTFSLFCLIALCADRFWPIWVSALLGLGMLGHLARAVEPDLFWWAYAVSLTIWSYPILALIALGTWTHRRRGLLETANALSSRWYTKYRALPPPRNRRQSRID